jgi:hypothetical protein
VAAVSPALLVSEIEYRRSKSQERPPLSPPRVNPNEAAIGGRRTRRGDDRAWGALALPTCCWMRCAPSWIARHPEAAISNPPITSSMRSRTDRLQRGCLDGRPHRGAVGPHTRPRRAGPCGQL